MIILLPQNIYVDDINKESNTQPSLLCIYFFTNFEAPDNLFVNLFTNHACVRSQITKKKKKDNKY